MHLSLALTLDHGDVAEILHLITQLGEASIQIGDANRRRSHVDAAPSSAQVERRADDRDVSRSHNTNLTEMWRTHSCVPRRHSCRRLAKSQQHGVHTSVNAARTSACATYSYGRVRYSIRGNAMVSRMCSSPHIH